MTVVLVVILVVVPVVAVVAVVTVPQGVEMARVPVRVIVVVRRVVLTAAHLIVPNNYQ